MGTGRYSYDNMIITSSTLTASTIWAGTVGSSIKSGTGSGTMTPSGAYSGTADLLYTIEIDGAGDVGAATFKWRSSASSGWEAETVTTATTTTVLEYAVQVQFAAGTGTDFAVEDSWTFKATRFFAPSKIIDLDPDTPWRSETLSSRPALADVNIEVYDHSATSFTDKTTEAFSDSSSTTGAFWVDISGGDYLYVGCVVPFDRITVDVSTAAVGAGALTVQFYNGSAWTGASGVTDGTDSGGNSMAQDGEITFTIPSTWAKQGHASIDSTKYYIRLKSASDPSTDPIAERLVPISLPETVTIDLATAQTPTIIIIHGHNISSTATAIQLLGNSSDEWGSPASTTNITHATDTMVSFISVSAYRYWQLRFSDDANADGYVKIGEVFLGTYFEPTRNFVLDFDEAQEIDEEDERTAAGISRPIFRNRSRSWDLPYRVLPAADRANFTTLFETIKNRSEAKSKPMFFTPDGVTTPAETYLVNWIGPLSFIRRSSSHSDLRVMLEERPLSSF